MGRWMTERERLTPGRKTIALLVSAVATACFLCTAANTRGSISQATATRPAAQQTEVPAGPGSGQQFGGEIDVTVVRINVVALNAKGEPITDIKASELKVLEDGQPVEVLSLDPSLMAAIAGGTDSAETHEGGAPTIRATPWDIVIYASSELSGRFQLPELLRRVAGEAARLTELGPVSVVMADPDPWLVVENVRRPDRLADSLETIASQTFGQSKIELIRQRLVKEFRPGVGFDIEYDISQESPRMRAARARAAVRQELHLIRTNLERMVGWLESRPPTRRGLLVWVTGGFDIDPAEFYIPLVSQVDPFFGRSMRMEYTNRGLQQYVKQIIAVALGHGWTVMPVLSTQPTSFLYGSDVTGAGRVDHFTGVESTSIDSQESSFQTDSPGYPLAMVAEATGGEMVRRFEVLDTAITRVRSAYYLSYQVERPADGRIHLLQIQCSRPGAELHFARAVASGTLKSVATARGQRLLQTAAGGVEPGREDATAAQALEAAGTMPVSLTLSNVREADRGVRIARLEVTADLGEMAELLAASGKGTMRVSVIVQVESRAPFAHHQEMPLVRTGSGNLWRFTTDLKWPDSAEQLAVVTEELSTGIWGAATIPLPEP